MLDENAIAGGLPENDEEDESLWDEETKLKHRQFKSALLSSIACLHATEESWDTDMRKSHYNNEAEAMKKAQELLAKEDEEAVDDDDAEEMEVEQNTQRNGSMNGRTHPLPNGSS